MHRPEGQGPQAALVGIAAAQAEGEAIRHASTAAAPKGLAGDLFDTGIHDAQAITGSGDDFAQADIGSIKRLLPGTTLPGIRSLVEDLGVPAVEQAAGIS